jgi:hypothetical protein
VGHSTWLPSRAHAGEGDVPKAPAGDAPAADAVRGRPEGPALDGEAGRPQPATRLKLRLRGY